MTIGRAATARRMTVPSGATWLLWAGAVMGAAPAAAQSLAQDYYWHNGEPVPVVLHLDSIGVAVQYGASIDQVTIALQPYGLHWVRELPESLHLFALASPVSRDLIVARSRLILEQQGALVRNAGPLARWVGNETPWVLTDQLLVRFRDSATPEQVDSLNDAHQALQVRRSAIVPTRYVVQITAASGGDALQVAKLYQASPLVETVYPNLLGGALPTHGRPAGAHTPAGQPPRALSQPPVRHVPNDPLFPLQWHLDNSGAGHINAVDAWDTTLGNPGTVIAIIEITGFDVAHKDLASRLWINTTETLDGADNDGNDWIDDINGCGFKLTDASTDPDTFDPACDLALNVVWHGTAVAGLAAAEGDNALGVTGVCPSCRLMLLATGSSLDGKVEAFDYAVDKGADVINASWAMTLNTELENAVIAAATSSSQGIPIVFTMRNADTETCSASPELTSLAQVFAVGASSDGDQRLPAAWGKCIDVLAPGGAGSVLFGITTTDALSAAGYNTGASISWGTFGSKAAACSFASAEPNDQYTRCFGGTSAAAPIVAGVMGLILSKNPGLTRDEVYTIVRQSAEKIDPSGCAYASGFSEKCGWGRVNAAAALEATPAATTPGGGTSSEASVDTETWEIGTRLGLTVLSGSFDWTVASVPGSGPRAVPVLYGARVTPSWMLELQLGLRHESYPGSPPSYTELVLALQPALFINDWYVGPNAALRYVKAFSAATRTAAGIALGYRWKPVPFLGVRLEARYRHWPSLHETGLALGAGVVF
jgi:subtilisin family serine protease